MLREAGKRSQPALLVFLKSNYSAIPRTALRYAIEHLPEAERKGSMEYSRRGLRRRLYRCTTSIEILVAVGKRLITLGTTVPSKSFSTCVCQFKIESMRRKLLQLFSGMCRHEFAWPRKSPEGDYYQVCLLCGDEYQYDWPTMQRLGKRADRSRSGEATNADLTRKSSWSPRARRLRVPIAVEFRRQSVNQLLPGTIENISQSGLFIRSEHCPSKGELLETIFEMPLEISGQQNAQVLCAGQVVRIATETPQDLANAFAVSVIDYRFVHSDGR